MLDLEGFRRSLETVTARVEAACLRCGRSPLDVRVMAVTKTFGYEYAQLAVDAGVRLFGENRVQEAAEKWAPPPDEVELHLIGHLQRNKAKIAAGLFSAVQSIDSAATAVALARRCEPIGRVMDVLVEVNTSGEDSKAGLRRHEELESLLSEVESSPHLRVRGLMTVGPLTPDHERVRAAFASLRALFDGSRSRRDPEVFDTLSMGMSGDYEIAVEEGATLLRLGTALFGRRPVQA